METGNRHWSDCVGKLLLRISIGGLMLFHGVDKVMHKEHFDMVVGAVKAHNLPDMLAYGVYVGELVASALVLVGFLTRFAAAVVAIDMGVAVWLAHVNSLWTLNDGGGWALELQGLYFLGALCIVFLGAGRMSIDGWLWSRSANGAVSPPETK
jgi:putative oxidoreductase